MDEDIVSLIERVQRLDIKVKIFVSAICIMLVLAIIGIIALGVSRRSTIDNKLNGEDPGQSADTLNSVVSDLIDTFPVGSTSTTDLENWSKNFSDKLGTGLTTANAKIKFDASISDGKSSNNILSIDASGRSVRSGNTSNIELSGTVNLDLSFFGKDTMPFDLVVGDTAAYLRITSLPTTLLSLVSANPKGVDSLKKAILNKWIKFDTASTIAGSAVLSSLEDGQKQKLLSIFQNAPLFVNPQAVSTRDIFTSSQACMTTDINMQALSQVTGAKPSNSANSGASIEFCGRSDKLPYYVGITFDSQLGGLTTGSSTMKISFEVGTPEDNSAVTIPKDTVSSESVGKTLSNLVNLGLQ